MTATATHDAAAVDLSRLLTWANGVTVLRTGVSVALAFVALLEASAPLLVAAYLVYWIGDSADGITARVLHQETRTGAVLDVVCDRACSSVLVATLLVVRPEFAWPLALYFVQFMTIDLLLTLGFLAWPLVSPNEFHRVDRLLWRLNWSVPAKTANTTLLLVVLLVAPVWVATVLAVAQLALKTWSTARLASLLRAGAPCSPA